MAEIEKRDAKVLAALIVWAYRNDVEFAFYKRHDYGGGSGHPVVRFIRGHKHCEYAFWPLTDIEGQAKNLTERMAMDLVTEPIDLSWIERD